MFRTMVGAFVGLLCACGSVGCGPDGGKPDGGTASTSESTSTSEVGGEGGSPECYYTQKVTLTRAEYESWAMGVPTPIDDTGSTGDSPDPTTGTTGATTDAGTTDTGTTDTTDTSTTSGVMLDEQQVCQMVCAAVTPGDPAARGGGDCTVIGAMGSGDVQIECSWQIGCA